MKTDLILRQALQAIEANAPVRAARILNAHVSEFPNDTAALSLLGELQLRLGRPDRALDPLRQALLNEPSDNRTYYVLVQTLTELGHIEEALDHARRLRARSPDDAIVLNLLAKVQSLIGDHEDAAVTYERLLALAPDDGSAWVSYGHVLRMLGRTIEAIAAFRRAIDLRRNVGEACWGLADLKTYRFTEDEIGLMREQLSQIRVPAIERSNLLYSLGKALEDQGDVTEAFGAYCEAAKLRVSRSAVLPQLQDFVDRSVELFSPSFFEARRARGSEACDPIFIVGLPRAGSTLVEHILASHSMVEATMELPDLQTIARECTEPALRDQGYDYLHLLAQEGGLDPRQRGQAYLASTRVRRKTGRPFFIDKQSSNWVHLGLIHLILPNAKIIDARRHPMACGWSCFKQNFVTGQSFSYSLTQIGLYYRQYARLLAHFDVALPGRVHRVVHESLVRDPERHIRALLDHCGLPFEEQCLRPDENKRVVRTSSAEQVREPISAQNLEKWRRFEPLLDELRDALGPAIDAYPNAP